MFTFKGVEEEADCLNCLIGRLYKLYDETSHFVAVLSLSSLL